MVRGRTCRLRWLQADDAASLGVPCVDVGPDDLAVGEEVHDADLEHDRPVVLSYAMLVVEPDDSLVVDPNDLVPARVEPLDAGEVVREAVEHLARASVDALAARPVVLAAHVPNYVRSPLRREAVEVEALEGVECSADDLLVGRRHFIREANSLPPRVARG